MTERSGGESFQTENLLCAAAVTFVSRWTYIRAFGITVTSLHDNNIPLWIYFNVQL
jgi:hypothetical protein